MEKYQVIYRAYVHDCQGYSRAAREYILALDRQGVDVKVVPLSNGDKVEKINIEGKERINKLIKKPFANDKKKILIHHLQPNSIEPNFERTRYDKVIINTVFETDKIPSNWFPSINQADAVFVPSKQNEKAFIDSGVTVPIYLYPHGSDESFNPRNRQFPLNLKDEFKFLSVFKWEHRKAPDVLLQAYWQEFTKRDKVVLLIKSSWGNGKSKNDHRALVNQIVNYKRKLGFNDNTAQIYFAPGSFNEEDLKGLYTLADCFVLPSRGEGVGLPYIEALSSGIPCISTNWGGQVDFLNENNSFLVDYELKPTNFNNGTNVAPNFTDIFKPDMNWAEPSFSVLRKKMRYAYEHREEVKLKGKQGRKDMKNMTWDQSAINIKRILEEVLKVD